MFRRPLLALLQRFAAPRWDETAKHAWEMAYNRAATIMMEAAKDDAAKWIATVTGIELRGPDVAVLTLQPEQPLNYLPGQHISVQTPHWPRLWRTYSIANIPRSDGLLRLHVHAVTGGLASPVLLPPRRMSRTSSGACRRTRRSATRHPRPRPCRTAAAPAR